MFNQQVTVALYAHLKTLRHAQRALDEDARRLAAWMPSDHPVVAAKRQAAAVCANAIAMANDLRGPHDVVELLARHGGLLPDALAADLDSAAWSALEADRKQTAARKAAAHARSMAQTQSPQGWGRQPAAPKLGSLLAHVHIETAHMPTAPTHRPGSLSPLRLVPQPTPAGYQWAPQPTRADLLRERLDELDAAEDTRGDAADQWLAKCDRHELSTSFDM